MIGRKAWLFAYDKSGMAQAERVRRMPISNVVCFVKQNQHGILATRSGLKRHDGGWALPAGLLALILN